MIHLLIGKFATPDKQHKPYFAVYRRDYSAHRLGVATKIPVIDTEKTGSRANLEPVLKCCKCRKDYCFETTALSFSQSSSSFSNISFVRAL